MDWSNLWDGIVSFFRDAAIRVLEFGAPVVNAAILAAAFVANPFLNLIYPPLKEFVPKPAPAPAAVEKHSIADYSIVYGAGATAQEKYAARILAETLSEITGNAYAAAEQASPAGAKEILVGGIAGLDVSRLGAEGYSIQPRGDNILIAGGHPRGTIYGAYQFLQKYFDCRWYTAELRAIPENPGAMIAEVQTVQYVPPFEYREMDWQSRSDPAYSLANGLNGSYYRNLTDEQGGTVYIHECAHTMTNLFVKPSQFYASNPEWYAYREDSKTREPSQLCLTNAQALAQLVAELRALLARYEGPVIIPVSQADNKDYCQCANCKALDAQEGSPAGTLLRFVNAAAADIRDDFPDARIHTFAYEYTRRPPRLTKPLPNVVVQLAPIDGCYAHPFDDPKCPVNVEIYKDLKGWSEIAENLYLWDYSGNYAHYNSIVPNFHVLQRNMQLFAQFGVTGDYPQGIPWSDQFDSEYAQLRGYLLSRLLFDPDIDYGAEMDGFLRVYYGGGWQYVREFIGLLGANCGKPDCLGRHRKGKGIYTYASPLDKLVLDLKPNQIAYADKLWEKAIALAGSGACERNVRHSQLSWRFWKSYNKAGQFSRFQPLHKWQGANKQLYNDFQAAGITKYNMRNYMIAASWWGTPRDWVVPM